MKTINLIDEVYFLGSNYNIAQIIDRLCPVKHICCERRKFNLDIYNFAEMYSIEFNVVETRQDLRLVLPKKINNMVGISYGFGIIFKSEHIELFKHGIWNIHPGELPKNRGRHPISWGFLNGCKKFGISIHEINEEIDRGYLLSKGYVNRDLNDTQKEIEGKMEKLLEYNLVENAFKNYYSGKKRKLGKGIYCPSLAERYRSISPEDYDSKFLFNLFKSQVTYGGIIVRGKRYKECIFYNESFSELYAEYDIFVCKDDKAVGLK